MHICVLVAFVFVAAATLIVAVIAVADVTVGVLVEDRIKTP